jgi:hypothetical protein
MARVSIKVGMDPGNDLPAGGMITDIKLPPGLDGAGPLPVGSRTAKLAAGELLVEASAVAKPKAAWRLALVEPSKGPSGRLEVGGAPFRSQLIDDNLKGLGRAFPFLATEGRELAEWAERLPTRLRAAAFLIRYAALKEAERRLEERLAAEYGLTAIGAMSPGVLPQWPLAGQKALFDLLAPFPELLGVTLSPRSMWMSPDMTSSGLFFETGAGFHNCRLCPLDKCPLRRFERSG